MDPSLLPLMLLLISNIHPGQTQGKPKAAVIIETDKNGTVTVRCEIPGPEDGWIYSWFKEGSSHHISSDREFTLRTGVSDSRINITCKGERRSDGQKSEISDAVTLTVSWQEASEEHGKPPKPLLTVHPEPSQIFRGETVTLTCDVQGEGWTYRWQCGDEQHNSAEKEFNITVRSKQSCKCEGCGKSFCSQWSDAVTLTVLDKPKVTVNPQSSVFTGDTVTLSCDVGRSSEWTILWYKNSQTVKTDNKTKKLSGVGVSDGGKYTCSVKTEKYSSIQGQGVMLTVRERPKPVVRVQPDGRVFRGQTVTLTCDIPQTDVSSWIYRWKKDDSVIHVSQSQEYRISSFNESHTGHYSCTGNENQGSRYSHTSDKVTLTVSVLEFPEAHALIIGVIAGLSCAFLFIFGLLLLFWSERNNGGGPPSLSTDHQLQNISQTSEHQRNNGQTTSCSNIVIGPSCVTYVKIDLKSMNEMRKKKKENKEKESSDTVYSKVKF